MAAHSYLNIALLVMLVVVAAVAGLIAWMALRGRKTQRGFEVQVNAEQTSAVNKERDNAHG